VTGSGALLAATGVDLWPERFGYSLQWPAGSDAAPVVVSSGQATIADLIAALPALARTQELPLSVAGAKLFVTPSGLAVLTLGDSYAVASRIDTLTAALPQVPSETHAASVVECTLRMLPKQHELPHTIAVTITNSTESRYEFRITGQFATADRARSALDALTHGLSPQVVRLLGAAIRFDRKGLQWADRVVGYVSSADLQQNHPNTGLLFRWLLQSERSSDQVLSGWIAEQQRAAR
jgi:hypothetical protein